MQHSTIAAIEADQAKIARATTHLEVLEALALLSLQEGLLDVEQAERVFEALGLVVVGVQAGHKWLALLRNGEVEL